MKPLRLTYWRAGEEPLQICFDTWAAMHDHIEAQALPFDGSSATLTIERFTDAATVEIHATAVQRNMYECLAENGEALRLYFDMCANECSFEAMLSLSGKERVTSV
jgi:hypothetical protein